MRAKENNLEHIFKKNNVGLKHYLKADGVSKYFKDIFVSDAYV